MSEHVKLYLLIKRPNFIMSNWKSVMHKDFSGSFQRSKRVIAMRPGSIESTLLPLFLVYNCPAKTCLSIQGCTIL